MEEEADGDQLVGEDHDGRKSWSGRAQVLLQEQKVGDRNKPKRQPGPGVDSTP